MKISNFLSSLLSSISKDRVLEDCRITREEIQNYTKPAFDTAIPLMRKWNFKSTQVKDKMDQFKRFVKANHRDNAVVVIGEAWPIVLENLKVVEELSGKFLTEEIATSGLTYAKANLLQLVECFSFVSKFSRKFLNYVFVYETAEYSDQSGTVPIESLTPAEIEWIEKNFLSFCTAFSVVSGIPTELKKRFDEIPDIVVTSENAKTLPETVGEAKLDPFQMRFIPVVLNPIYHIGMMVAEWQADRYKAAKEEKKLLELRILNLQKLQEKKPDAALQKEIEYTESRVLNLTYKIAKMEKENA